jgi:hypothetical protein
MDDDYIIKVMPYDTQNAGVIPAVMGAGYNFIAIERRNPLSAYLSGIISFRHQVWHITEGEERPVYESFVASKEEILGIAKGMSLYYHYRDRLNPSAILYYEDMAAQPVTETLKQAGVYQEGVITRNTPTKKLLSFDDKAKLIINLEEVIDHLTGILMAYNVTMEHNNL